MGSLLNKFFVLLAAISLSILPGVSLAHPPISASTAGKIARGARKVPLRLLDAYLRLAQARETERRFAAGQSASAAGAQGGATTTESSASLASESEDAEEPERTRLQCARDAEQRGESELALHEYRASLFDDPSTADAAIQGAVDLFLRLAQEHSEQHEYAEECAQIVQCYGLLVEIEALESPTFELPERGRHKIFEQRRRLLAYGRKRAESHFDAAARLYQRSQGWLNDDEGKQADALHFVNLAWAYYPAFTNDELIKRLYGLWADLKNELSTSQYDRVMECDRARLGRAVGEQ